MSRIGKKLIAIPEGVTVEHSGKDLSVKGPKGLLSMTLVKEVVVEVKDGKISLNAVGKTKVARSMWGMQRTMVSNLIEGVTNGYEKKLEIKGVGYRAQMKGNTLNLQLGYSHEIDFPVPEGVTVQCPDQTNITISGIDKQKVGQVAAKIREYRKPEPYKGKGVKYAGEYIFRKEGKKK
ncbi:MAG: 50S ribosomal protein L6 [Sphingomonadales bacterium]